MEYKSCWQLTIYLQFPTLLVPSCSFWETQHSITSMLMHAEIEHGIGKGKKRQNSETKRTERVNKVGVD